LQVDEMLFKNVESAYSPMVDISVGRIQPAVPLAIENGVERLDLFQSLRNHYIETVLIVSHARDV